MYRLTSGIHASQHNSAAGDVEVLSGGYELRTPLSPHLTDSSLTTRASRRQRREAVHVCITTWLQPCR